MQFATIWDRIKQKYYMVTEFTYLLVINWSVQLMCFTEDLFWNAQLICSIKDLFYTCYMIIDILNLFQSVACDTNGNRCWQIMALMIDDTEKYNEWIWKSYVPSRDKCTIFVNAKSTVLKMHGYVHRNYKFMQSYTVVMWSAGVFFL